METSILERPQAFGVLRLVADRPGSTASALAGVHGARDRTKEVRLAELVEAGVVEAREDLFKGRPCRRYHLTARGEALLHLVALIEKL